jgi:hypothetical protein
MVPCPGNDHAILPSPEHDRLYLEYGPLFNQLKARTWLLKPGVISVAEGIARANIFETPGHYVIFVGLGKQQKNAQVRVRGSVTKARLFHPGEASESTLSAESQKEVQVFDVPLKRGCGMLVLEKI